jgi:hypothetical protein
VADPLEGFEDWLRARGTPEAQLDSHVQGAQQIVSFSGPGRAFPKHVDAAGRDAESAGATPVQLANLQRVGEAFVRFHAERPASMPPPRARISVPANASVGAYASDDARCSCGGMVILEYGQRANKAAGGIGGIIGAGSVFLCGCLGAGAAIATIAGGMMLIGGLIAAQRCTMCGQKLPSEQMSDGQRSALRNQRLKLFGGGLGLGALGIVLLLAWFSLNAAMVQTWRHR